MFTMYRIVKRNVAESVPDRASVHTRNAAFEVVSAQEKCCSALLLKVEPGGGGGGDSTLIRRVCAIGVLNLSPCSGVGKPKKDTLFWSYHSIVLYCIVLY